MRPATAAGPSADVSRVNVMVAPGSIWGDRKYAVAGLIYAWVLRFVPLHMAQVIVAAQFIGVIIAARFLLSESINVAQWGGVALIAAGIVITGWSFDPA